MEAGRKVFATKYLCRTRSRLSTPFNCFAPETCLSSKSLVIFMQRRNLNEETLNICLRRLDKKEKMIFHEVYFLPSFKNNKKYQASMHLFSVFQITIQSMLCRMTKRPTIPMATTTTKKMNNHRSRRNKFILKTSLKGK